MTWRTETGRVPVSVSCAAGDIFAAAISFPPHLSLIVKDVIVFRAESLRATGDADSG